MNLFKRKIKEILEVKIPRERLYILKVVLTNKATYIIYETQTIENDWINIEIEKISNNKAKIILEDEIFDDSWDILGGTAFSGLIIDAQNHLTNYILENNEIIIQENEIWRK